MLQHGQWGVHRVCDADPPPAALILDLGSGARAHHHHCTATALPRRREHPSELKQLFIAAPAPAVVAAAPLDLPHTPHSWGRRPNNFRFAAMVAIVTKFFDGRSKTTSRVEGANLLVAVVELEELFLVVTLYVHHHHRRQGLSVPSTKPLQYHTEEEERRPICWGAECSIKYRNS